MSKKNIFSAISSSACEDIVYNSLCLMLVKDSLLRELIGN